jgi:hypothetical protein
MSNYLAVCRLDIVGNALRHRDFTGEAARAQDTAEPLKLLQAAGASISGRTKTEELHLGCALMDMLVIKHLSSPVVLEWKHLIQSGFLCPKYFNAAGCVGGVELLRT